MREKPLGYFSSKQGEEEEEEESIDQGGEREKSEGNNNRRKRASRRASSSAAAALSLALRSTHTGRIGSLRRLRVSCNNKGLNAPRAIGNGRVGGGGGGKRTANIVPTATWRKTRRTIDE